MKGSLLVYCLLSCFKSINALYPVSSGQPSSYKTGEHRFQRRSSEREMKPFNVTVNCMGPQCEKVSDTFNLLTNTLSSIIEVKNQIKIMVTFVSYCKLHKDCEKKDRYNARSSSASGYGSLKNKEGQEIVYPRALYKQLADPSELEKNNLLKNNDISINFNSDLEYWFEGDGNIGASQPNFSLIAADGLIKGLGVYITIQAFGNNELVFFPSFTYNVEETKPRHRGYIKFSRYILDSLLVTTSDGKSINSLLDPFIDFKSDNIPLPIIEIDSYLKNTTLIEISKKIEKLASTPDSLAIKLPSGNSLILETSAHPLNPLLPIQFISESKHLHSKEALLTSKVIFGEEQLPQGKAEDWPTYPFGPLLIETLELMGYTLKDSYKNSSAYLNSDKEEDKENNKSGTNDSNIFKANTSILFILLSLYLFN